MSVILNSLNDLTNIVNEHIGKRKKAELYDANKFNPFDFMKTDEVGLSSILGFLLNPNEKHGQGDIFLNSFIKYINKPAFLAYNKVQLVLEKSTIENRRHDIFIEGWLDNKRVWVISIENKLRGASDQISQMNAYKADLERYGTNYFLIYLSPFERFPTNDSIKQKDWRKLVIQRKAINLFTKDIIEWLDNTPIIAAPVKRFCIDLQHFLGENIMKIDKNNDELVQYIMNDNEMLNTALVMIDNSEQLYINLINILEKQLKDKIYRKYPLLVNYGLAFYSHRNFTDKYFGFFFDKEGYDWGIGIEFSNSWLQNGYYGVYANKDIMPQDKYEKIQSIFKNLQCNGRTSKYWLKWNYFDTELKDWNADVLRQIPTGELAEKLYKNLKLYLEFIQENFEKLKD